VSSTVQLGPIAALVLTLTASGCWCRNVPDDVHVSTREGTFEAENLDDLRAGTLTDAERCEAACMMLADGEGTESGDPLYGDDYDSILSCTATGADETLPPWDAAQTEVLVMCELEYRSPGFCTGRRPLGHRELTFINGSRAAWFAEQAYLERASITAFEQLATWLADREAPAELVERCRAAAADEVVHAQLMSVHAERDGHEVPLPIAEPGSHDLLAIALHNAVEGCVRESFGALLGAHQARTCENAELRELFARIADDELRHGQLAWDLHAYFQSQLDEAGRAQVEAAQLAALDELAGATARNAERTPVGLGWPTPELAADMAERFAGLVQRSAAA
jgi:hypothetical protein